MYAMAMHDDSSIRVRRGIKNRIDDYKKQNGFDSFNDALDRLLTMAETLSEIEELKREIQRLKSQVDRLEKKG